MFSGEITNNQIGVDDLNGDSIDDVVFTNYSTGVVRVGFGSTTGTFNQVSTFASLSGATASTLADFDGNGTLDIAIAGQSANRFGILFGGGKDVSELGRFSLATQSEARTSLDFLAKARDRLGAAFGKLGAEEARLTVAASVLLASRIGADEAASRIVDADVADESSVLVRTRILQQVSAAVLAQANVQPQIALRLLRDE